MKRDLTEKPDYQKDFLEALTPKLWNKKMEHNWIMFTLPPWFYQKSSTDPFKE